MREDGWKDNLVISCQLKPSLLHATCGGLLAIKIWECVASKSIIAKKDSIAFMSDRLVAHTRAC